MMGLVSVVAAAAAAYAVGAVWYMVFGKRWMKAVGLTEKDVQSGSKAPFLIAAIGAVIVAGALRLMFARLGIDGALEGLRWGALVGAFIAAPWIITNYAFADRPRALWWIDAGHAALAVSAAGLVLGALH